jgi:hypothetical protein
VIFTFPVANRNFVKVFARTGFLLLIEMMHNFLIDVKKDLQ